MGWATVGEPGASDLRVAASEKTLGTPDLAPAALRTTYRWMQALMAHCPRWRSLWEQALHGLAQKGSGFYNSLYLVREAQGVRITSYRGVGVGGGRGGVLTDRFLEGSKESAWFEVCHKDLASMVDALPHAWRSQDGSFERLVSVLLLQWPGDVAWTQAIRSRIAVIQAVRASRKHDADVYPRLLARRRQAFVMERIEGDLWKTRRGAGLDAVMRNNAPERNAAIFALTGLPGLRRLELPYDVDFGALLKVLNQVQRAMRKRHPLVVKAKKEKRPWDFAVRRIQGLGLNGCFDAATQTIIVDPRHLESMLHELCHWLLGHDVASSRRSLIESEGEVDALVRVLF